MMKKKLYYLSIAFVVIGILAFVYRMSIPEKIDENGILTDNLGWIVGGYLAIFSGIVLASTTAITSFIKNKKEL